LLAGFSLLLLVGCDKLDFSFEEPKPVPFEIRVHVESDPGKPILGAQILAGTKIVGKTDASGFARLKFGGTEGDQVELGVKCPSDYDSPSKPLTIALRRLAQGSRPPQFDVRCAPIVRSVVVGVRADQGPNLPITVLGRTVARTDASGAAIFTMQVKPSEQVVVTLSTEEKGAERLRPQNPTLTFLTKDKDDFIVLDQPFKLEPKKYKPPPPKNIPRPLDH
jgi:hypothetical protein